MEELINARVYIDVFYFKIKVRDLLLMHYVSYYVFQ